jgi:flagellin-like protein
LSFLYQAIFLMGWTMMSSLRSDRTGVSEIVGALMLVLIVVVAASSLAIFISQQQQAIQEQEAQDQRKELESLDVLSIRPELRENSTELSRVTFHVANLAVEDSKITSVVINSHDVKYFNITDGDGITVHHSYEDTILLGPRDQVDLSVDLNGSSFFDDVVISITDYLIIDLNTYYLNTFTSTFVPPTAVAMVSSTPLWNGTGYDYYTLLDGRDSFASGSSEVVSWIWTVYSIDNETHRTEVLSGSGATVLINPLPDGQYLANLTIADSNGMIGLSSILFQLASEQVVVYKAPPSAIIDIASADQWNAAAGNYTTYLVLDGTRSTTVPGANIVAWSWTIRSSDGSFNVTLSGSKVRFDPTYNGTAPTINITLNVTDDRGQWNNATIANYTLGQPYKILPSPVIMWAAGEQWNATSGTYDQYLILDGAASTSTNGTSIIGWTWRIGDKIVDPTQTWSLSGSKVRFDPTQAGNYTVTLTVTDSQGQSSSKNVTVYVSGPREPYHGNPSAIAKVIVEQLWNSTSGTYEPYLILDGLSSEAADGSYIVSYQWTVNATNGLDDQSLTGMKVRLDNKTTGEYVIVLKVTDNYGNTSTSTVRYVL